MSDEKSAGKTRPEVFSAVLKDVVSALRDSVLFLLFVLLLFTPDTIRERMVAAGFTKGAIAGFEWAAEIKSAAEQTKTVGQAVGQATEEYTRLIERLTELEKKVTDPGVKAEVKAIGQVAESSRTELVGADRDLKRSLATQQQVVQRLAPATDEAPHGWMFLGRVTQDRQTWVGGGAQTVGGASLPLTAGQVLTVRDDAYLRADGPPNARSSAPIHGVAKVGDTVEILAIDYSSARAGGWFVWAHVKRQ